MAARECEGERRMFRLIFSSLLGLLVVACPLRGDQPGGLAEGVRALYRGEYDRAASLAASFVKAHPEASAGFILLARTEIAQGKYQPAYENLRQALRLAPTSVDALYYLGRVALILSQVQYRELYDLAPDSARVHQLLAESYRAQEKTAEAEQEYKAALEASPRSVEVLDALGDLERSSNHYDEALPYYSRAADIAPRDYNSVYGLGASYLLKFEPERAIEYFRKALKIDPKSAAARFAVGDALLRVGKAQEAVAELKAAVALEPEMEQAYRLLGRAYQKLGQKREAEEAFKKSKEVSQEGARKAQPSPEELGSPAENSGNTPQLKQ